MALWLELLRAQRSGRRVPDPPTFETLVAEACGPRLQGPLRVERQMKSNFLHKPGVANAD